MRSNLPSDPKPVAAPGRPIEVAFVNNMPDAAVAATWTQFSRLLHGAAGSLPLQIRRYVMRTLPRSDTARHDLVHSYDPIDALYGRGADILIVSGAEPRAAALHDEPYWDEFTRLVDWARDNTVSALWSCLAAHGAVLHLDGIERRPHQRKISGVYTFAATPDNGLLDMPGGTVAVPHSRYNGLPKADLETRGYRIATSSEEKGVDLFWRREPSLFVFTQGHLEYDPETLLKEYRRDVFRYLCGESPAFPDIPENYFSARTAERLTALKQAALAGEGLRSEEVTSILTLERLSAVWTEPAQQLYRQWLALVADDIASRYAVPDLLTG